MSPWVAPRILYIFDRLVSESRCFYNAYPVTRISSMQPYFLPYAGYFRLMCDVDAFVISAGVQFPSRGWVNRNFLRDDLGRPAWFTLPLAPRPTKTAIVDLRYAQEAELILRKNAQRFAACRAPVEHTVRIVRRALETGGAPLATIETLLRETADTLNIRAPFVIDSELNLPPGIRGVERIYAICAALGADAYVNAPGGRSLYNAAEFAKRGVTLTFLPDYRGDFLSILQRLHDQRPSEITAEIRANLE